MAMKSKLFFTFLLFSALTLLVVVAKQDPELKRQVKKCQKQCDESWQRPGEERQLCRFRCQHQFRESEEREEGGEREERERERGHNEKGLNPRREEEEEEEEEENPYVFRDRHFSSKFESQEGRLSVLRKFTEKSELLKGIENFRLAIEEINPQTFIIPNHLDAESVCVVVRGQGTLTLIRENKRESFNIKCGDIVRVPPGITHYVMNKDDNEKLFVAKLLKPVSNPRTFEAFFGPGGEEPESFFRAFSIELLEAAFKTKRDKIQKVIGQQRQGAIVKASKEQIRSLSHHDEEGGVWPFGGDRSGPFNLFKKRPSHSSQHGSLIEANFNDCRELQDLDLAISFANITRNSMEGPFYNSKATKIALVVDGEGYYEMACPHLSSQYGRRGHQGRGGGSQQQQQQGSPRYQKVKARLSRNTVFIVPAGHPVAVVNSGNQNLQIICFDVNAQDNHKFPLAGKKNVISLIEKEAKELGFGVPSREIEEVFEKNNEDFFFPGPGQRRERYEEHEGRAEA